MDQQPEGRQNPESQTQTETNATPSEQTTVETTPPGTGQVDLPPEKPRRNRKWQVWTFVTIIATVAIGFASWWFLIRDSDNKDTTAETAEKQSVELVRVGGFGAEFNLFYPADEVTFGTTLDMNLQIYEGLVQYEDETKIVPAVASDWFNPDDTTWVFNLKQDVKFHSGRTVTAADVAASIDLLKQTDGYLRDLYTSTIESATVVDEDTVRIITNGPDPLLLNRLAFIFIVDTATEKTGEFYPGTGPFIVNPEVEPEPTHTELVAFDDFHGGQPLTRAIHFYGYEDEDEMVADLKSDELDIAGPLTQENISQLQGNGLNALEFNAGNVYHFGLNSRVADSPLSKKEVREALYLAIDPQPFIEIRGLKAEVFDQIVTENIPGHNPTITRPQRNVERAKQLLASAGYPDGFDLEFTYFVPPAKAFGDELTRQLEPIGVRVTSVEKSPTEQLADTTQMYLLSLGSDLLDGRDVFAAAFQTNHYQNNELDTVLAEVDTTLDQAKRLELLQQASKIAMDDVGWLPLFIALNQWAVSDNLVLNRDINSSGFGVYFWQAYQ